MTSQTPLSPQKPPRSRWWNILFGLSLAANLAVVGAIAGHRYFDGPPGRMAYMQLLPREFFRELPRERRRELLQLIRPDMGGMGNMRQTMHDTSLRIADALEKQPYDPALVQGAIADFVTANQSLMMRGPELVSQVINTLTPEERVLLAKAIRERGPRSDRR